jgi:hypothetical protein
VTDEFWMKLFIDNGRLVAEPMQDSKPSKEEYLKRLMSLKSGVFTEEDYDDYKKIRTEMDEHVEKNSL